jgi:DNA repair protein SbcC/Rad50
MIKSIYLENWRTHKDTKLFFDQGTNTFIGNLGTGKSSIVDAICYCLYGDFPSRAHGKINLADVIMFKPLKKESAKVVLELETNNDIYRIEREIYKNKTNIAKLYKNNKLIAGPRQKEVTQEVSLLLGLDYSLFVTIVYSEQNELDYFLKIPPQKRKERFDELFGISQLSKIKESANEISKDLQKDEEKQFALLKQMESQLESFDYNDILKDLKEEQEKKRTLEQEVEEKKISKQNIHNKLIKQKQNKTIYDETKSNLKIKEYLLNILLKKINDLL